MGRREPGDIAGQAADGNVHVAEIGDIRVPWAVGDVEHRASAIPAKTPAHTRRRAVPGDVTLAIAEDKTFWRHGGPADKRNAARQTAGPAMAMTDRAERPDELK